jgi:hypothetical protein
VSASESPLPTSRILSRSGSRLKPCRRFRVPLGQDTTYLSIRMYLSICSLTLPCQRCLCWSLPCVCVCVCVSFNYFALVLSLCSWTGVRCGALGSESTMYTGNIIHCTRVPPPREQLYNRYANNFIIGTAVINTDQWVRFPNEKPPPRSLVCDGQTSPHRPRLVVSRSTCPPLSPPPTRTAL